MIDYTSLGYKVIATAKNGMEAYDRIRDDYPDVVITDIKMPILNGLELIERASRIDSRITFILLSGYGEFEYAKQAMKYGVRYYLLKPTDKQELINCLDTIREEKKQKEVQQKAEQALLLKDMQSPLEQGADSLQFLESSTENDICEIVVTYGISPLTEVLGFRKFRMANRYYGHLWNGYAIPGIENDEEYVYVTEDSEVYHRSRECTHLRLSVRRVEAAEIPKGYHPCEKCMVQKKDAAAPEENGYYICSEGECYHRRRDCPGLKRTVYCIARKDVDGYRECSRCGRI
jgi:YesN/AraC family two-component response regulator